MTIRARRAPSDDEVAEDVWAFFNDSEHWVYRKGRTPATCDTEWPYHISQLEVLFEDRYFHWVTNRAVHRLLDAGNLASEEVQAGTAKACFVWRRNVRYIRRPLKQAADLLAEYANVNVSRMTGTYAEDLVSLGLRASGFTISQKNVRSYRGKQWTTTGHDLDFIAERDGLAYGVEVKNTFPYMPSEEFDAKIEMCLDLGIIPLFVVRSRPAVQFERARTCRGTVYMFKSKAFPLGQEALVQRIWSVTRQPVDIFRELPHTFYDHVSQVHRRALDTMSL